MAPSVWLITGCSSGLGEELAKCALARGDRVIAAARNAESRLQKLKDIGAAPLDLDTTWPVDQLHAAAQKAIAIYGVVDIIVNNAAYIEGGAVEELSAEKLQLSLQTNALGPITFTQALLPHLRERKSGTVLFIGSLGPYLSSQVVGGAAYTSTKYYIEGIAQTLREELAAWNIRVAVVVLGYLRTEMWSDTNFKRGTLEKPSVAYKDFNQSILGMIKQVYGNEPGDPVKAAALIVDAVYGEGKAAGKKLPFRLPLGEDVIPILRARAKEFNDLCDEWESSASIGFQ